MKIIVAPDSFKDSLSALKASRVIKKAILNILPNAEVVEIPVSDGGEGLLDILIRVLGGNKIKFIVKDPLNRDIEAELGILNDNKIAIIEIARASGLELLNASERNPMITSSFGAGQLIKHALDLGCQEIIIGIGGSATNDGGMGMIKALGAKFLDFNNTEVPDGGGSLNQIYKIDLSKLDARITKCKIVVACDVKSPMTGKLGASFVYGKQKGGTLDQLNILDENLRHYVQKIKEYTGVEIESIEGSGAAGGIGGGLLAFLNAELKSGIDLMIEVLKVDQYIKSADLVITGEGKIDSQTLNGKAVSGIASIAKKHKVPVIVLTGKIGCGIDEIYNHGVTSIFSIVNSPMTIEESIGKVEYLLQCAMENIMRLLIIKRDVQH